MNYFKIISIIFMFLLFENKFLLLSFGCEQDETTEEINKEDKSTLDKIKEKLKEFTDRIKEGATKLKDKMSDGQGFDFDGSETEINWNVGDNIDVSLDVDINSSEKDDPDNADSSIGNSSADEISVEFGIHFNL